MSKNFFRHIVIILLLLVIILGGCNFSLQANQNTNPAPASSLLPSNTSSPTKQLSNVETTTVSSDTTTPIPLCDKVPEPQLNKLNDSSSNVYLSGTFYLCWYTEDSFDMDSGALGYTDPLGNIDTTLTDVELRATRATLDGSIWYAVLGANGAYITKSDVKSPTRDYCQEKTSNPTLGGGIILGETGMIGCVLTNEGRLGYIKVEKVNNLGTESLEISFVTWNKK